MPWERFRPDKYRDSSGICIPDQHFCGDAFALVGDAMGELNS